jgi:drug/metabolite transporter (DMT)-like permease
MVDLGGGGLLLLGAFLWSVGSIYDRETQLPESPLMRACMNMLAGGLGLLVLGTFSGEWTQLNLDAISQRSLIGLVYQIVFGSLVGYVAYTWLLHVAPTALVATYAYVVPLIAILLGNFLAQEPITPQIMISAGMILGSLVLVNTRRGGSRPLKLPQALPANED